MDKLTHSDLYTLEAYHNKREQMRRAVMAHKAARKVLVGPNAGIYFEDRLTIQYQIQEMLRVERVFEAEAIEEELETYNPLIPDGDNLKATLMIEYEDVEERRKALSQLIGVEDRVWVSVGESARVFAIADEDLERNDKEKTSAIHFLRFQLNSNSIKALKLGAALGVGIDHKQYSYGVSAVPKATREALAADLD